MKKLLALLLAVVMVVSLVACNTQKQPEETKAPAANKPEETKAPETQAPTDAPKEEVTITFHFTNFQGEQEHTGAVEEKLNELLDAMPGYEHISMDLVPYDTNFPANFALAEANGDQIDIVNHWLLDFDALVAQESVIPLDDLVAANPLVTSDIPEWLMEYGKYNGKLYYVPSYQSAYSNSFFWAPVEHFEYYYAASGNDRDDLADILQHGTLEERLAVMKDFRDAVAEGTGNDKVTIPGVYYPFHMFNRDDLEQSDGKMILLEGAEQPCYWTLSEEYETIIRQQNAWYKAGMMRAPDEGDDIAFESENHTAFYISTGNMGEEAYAAGRSSATGGKECDAIRMMDHAYIPSKRGNGGNAIHATCEHPEEAMMIIGLLMSEESKEFFNTLCYGLEGIHYEWIDKEVGRIKTLQFDGSQGMAETTYCCWHWKAGNELNRWLNQSAGRDDYATYIENELHEHPTTVVSPCMGMTWDLAAFSDQLSQLAAVNGEYYATVYAAEDIDATLKEYQDKLIAAGAKDLEAEMIKQYNAYVG